MTAGSKVYYKVYDGWRIGRVIGFHPFIATLAMVRLNNGACKYVPVTALEPLHE